MPPRIGEGDRIFVDKKKPESIHEKISAQDNIFRRAPHKFWIRAEKIPDEMQRYVWCYKFEIPSPIGIAPSCSWGIWHTTKLLPVPHWGRPIAASRYHSMDALRKAIQASPALTGHTIVTAGIEFTQEWPYGIFSEDPADNDLIFQEVCPIFFERGMIPTTYPVWSEAEGFSLTL